MVIASVFFAVLSQDFFFFFFFLKEVIKQQGFVKYLLHFSKARRLLQKFAGAASVQRILDHTPCERDQHRMQREVQRTRHLRCV